MNLITNFHNPISNLYKYIFMHVYIQQQQQQQQQQLLGA